MSNTTQNTLELTCDHDTPDVGLPQLLNYGRGLWLQFVLHHNQTHKVKVLLHLLPTETMPQLILKLYLSSLTVYHFNALSSTLESSKFMVAQFLYIL